jgi:hypothetical protein
MRIQPRILGMSFLRTEIMNLAESIYSDLSSKGEWNGVVNPGDDSVFLVQHETVCWGCGESGHHDGDTSCKRPKKHSQPTRTLNTRSKLRQGKASGQPPKKVSQMRKSSVGAPTSGTPSVTAGGARSALPMTPRTLRKLLRLRLSLLTPLP